MLYPYESFVVAEWYGPIRLVEYYESGMQFTKVHFLPLRMTRIRQRCHGYV